MSNRLTVQQELVLDELRAQYRLANQATDALDGKLTGLFGVASLLLTLLTGLQEQVAQAFPIVFAPYPVLVIVVLVAIWPRRVRSPMRLDWDAVCEEYLEVETQSAGRQLISNYLYAIEANLRRNRYKARLLSAAFILVVLQVVIFVVEILR